MSPVAPQRSLSGNFTLVLTIALAMGVMSFEQGSVGYLMPFIQPELRLSNTEIGAVASVYWATFAIASYGMGVIADRRRKVRNSLRVVLGAFGFCASLSGVSGGIVSLLLARAVMGILAGALLTLTQVLLGLGSTPKKVGSNIGVATGLGGSLSGLVLAPILLVQSATLIGWRASYFMIAVPSWLAAWLVYRNLIEPAVERTTSFSDRPRAESVLTGLKAILAYRNIVICALLCSLYIAYVGLGMTFLPLFFVHARGFSPSQMSLLVAVLGASSLLFSIVLLTISDKFGRKKILMLACGIGILTPLSAYAYHGPPVILAALLFVGWAMAGTGSFYMGIIPAETVSADILSRALGLVIAFGVLLGGLIGPSVAGWSADRWGAGAPLVVQGACAAFAMIAALALKETAPRATAHLGDRIVPLASVSEGQAATAGDRRGVL
jgi:ACS family hexuronate transporter-like MFS transporter